MKNKIDELFEILEISTDSQPEYKNPYDFSKSIQRCTKNVNVQISASNSSSQIDYSFSTVNKK